MPEPHDLLEERPLLSPELSEFVSSSTGDDDVINSSASSENFMLPVARIPDNLEDEITQARSSFNGVDFDEVSARLSVFAS